MNYNIDQTEIRAAAIIVGSILFFFFYYYFSNSNFLRQFILKRSNGQHVELKLFLVKKSSGLLIMGIIPGLLYYIFFQPDFGIFGLTSEHLGNNGLTILILVFIILIVLYINQKFNRQNNSLQITQTEWTLILFSLNATGWIVYLIGYEFLFRGILLFECYHSFGFWPAIAVNVAIYSAIHMVNGKEQAIGALVFGSVACYFTLTRETILIPLFMHISLSIMSDYFSIRLNNKLSFVAKTNNNLKKT